MASFIYWKLRSHLSYSTVTFDGHFVSVGEAKRLISSKINLPAEELVLTNAQTSTEFQDDSEQIPKGTSITVRRVPGGALKRRPIVNIQHAQPPKEPAAPAPAAAQQEDDFGSDPLLQQAEALKAQEEAARRAAVLATQTHQTGTALPPRGQQGQAGGRGSRARPYMTYVCPRCSAVGKHWESECPTQGDPQYDVRRVRAPAGMPTSKIVANPDGDFILPDGTLGQIQTDVSAYQKQAALMMGGLPEPEESQASMLALEGPSTMLALPAPQQPSQQTQNQQQQPSQPARTTTPGLSSMQQVQEPQPVASVAQSTKPSAGQPPHTPPRTHGQELTSQPSPEPTQQSPLAAPQQQQQKQQQTGGGLFDDDDDVLQAAAQPVKLAASGIQGSTAVPALSGGSRASPLGPGVVKPSLQEPSTDSCSEGNVAVGRAGRKAGAGVRVSNMSGLPDLDDEDMIQLERQAIPTELKKVVFATPRDFMDHMDSLQGWGLLPKADPKIWLLAFGSGLPLTPTEFKQLKARYGRKPPTEEHSKHRDRGRAKDSDTRDRRRSTSREDRRRHHQHHRSSRHRSRSNTRSRSRSRSRLRTKRDHQPASPGRWVPSSPSLLRDDKHKQSLPKDQPARKEREGKAITQEEPKARGHSNSHVSKEKRPSSKSRQQDDRQEHEVTLEAAQVPVKANKQQDGTHQDEDHKKQERSPEVEQPIESPSFDLEPQQSVSEEANEETGGETANGIKAMDEDYHAPSDSLTSKQQDEDDVMADADQPIEGNLLDVSPAVEEQQDDDSSKKHKKKHKKHKKSKSGDKDKEKKRKKKDEKSDKSGKRKRASDSGKGDEPASKRSSRQASSASDSDPDSNNSLHRKPAEKPVERRRDSEPAAAKSEPQPKSKPAVSARTSQPEPSLKATDKTETQAADKPARTKQRIDWDADLQKRAGRLLAGSLPGMLRKTTLDSRKRKPSGELPDTSNAQRSCGPARDDDSDDGGRWKHDKFRD